MLHLTCLSPEAKVLLQGYAARKGAKAEAEALQALPTCPGDQVLAVAESAPRGRSAVRRQASPRALFMGACIKRKYAATKQPVPELMRECSRRWKEGER